MSKYKVIQTQFRNAGSLIAALEDTGIPFEQSEDTRTNELCLYGVGGDRRPEQAAFVIRRHNISLAANDLGFAWDAESGSFQAIISVFDSGGQFRRGQQILNQVKQQYALHEVTQLYETQGYMAEVEQAEGGTLRLKLSRY